MKNNFNLFRILIPFIISILLLLLWSCKENLSPEQTAYIKRIEDHRNEYNEWMKASASSPFNLKSKVEFHDLNYFDIDPNFVFKNKLIQYDKKDTITIYGTKGEPRKTVRFGFVNFTYEKIKYKVNIYESSSKVGEKYYSIWFTDLTTNIETYGVGRYIDFELNNEPNYEYVIDFNLAYNPYCAYNSNFSCAIPTKEDFINIAITAGEKKFHD